MFRSGRWRNEKNKIKAVFKLQFQATQVPQLGWDSLLVSLVPQEIGKITIKTEKSIVQNGICSWEDPIYETVKFARELKTGKFENKIYQFLVSTGSSKAGFLGEISINFADYAEVFTPCSVTLPLKNSNSNTVLNVKIQRLPAAVDGREAEENGDTTERSNGGKTLRSKISDPDTDQISKPANQSNNSDVTDSSVITGIPQLRLSLNKMVPEHAEYNSNLRPSYCSDATSASSSDSSSGRDFPHQQRSSNNIHHDDENFLCSFSSNANNILLSGSPTEWSAGSAPDRSIEDSPNNSAEATYKESFQDPEISVERLKNEIAALARQAEVSELEIQTLRKQVVKESRRGQDLSKEICTLKEERDALKRECGKLKISQQIIDDGQFSNSLRFDSDNKRYVLDEIKQELNYEQELNANLRLQLQKTQESNSELLLAVRDLDEMLEQKNKEISCLSCNPTSINPEIYQNGQEMSPGMPGSCINETKRFQEVQVTPGHEIVKDEEQHELEGLVKKHNDAEIACSLEQRIKDLYSEIEVYRTDRDDLEMQMEQLALDYEILKQENHDISLKLEQNQLQEQLKMQYECAVPLSIINDLETHVEGLEKELEKQAEAFEADLAILTRARVEQEQRAIQAEEALRKTRWNNANTAERLQKEFKMLSKQMSSTFDENEKLAMKALTEASELRLQKSHLEDLLQKANEERGSVKDKLEEKLLDLSNQLDSKTKQIDYLISKLEYVSKQLENQKQSEEEKQRTFSTEITMLKTEIQMLVRDKNRLSEQLEEKEKLQYEMEELKIAVKDKERLLERGKIERDELEREVYIVREEVAKSLEELNDTKCLKDEKETMVGILQSEVEALEAQYNELKHSLSEDELEKENLRKQVFQLRGDLRKKDDAITIIEKKLKDNFIPKVTILNGTTKPALKNSNKSNSGHRDFKEVANLREKIKLLEGDLNLKEAALENSRQTYLKKEKDLYVKIEQLEKDIMELNHNNPISYKEIFQANSFENQNGEILVDENENFSKSEQHSAIHLQIQGIRDKQNKGSNAESDMRTVAENPDQNVADREQLNSAIGIDTIENLKAWFGRTPDPDNIVELVSAMELLMRKNRSMEDELQEMQQRYSKISLKFAEVEGERQQLVMTVRNLKNCKKN